MTLQGNLETIQEDGLISGWCWDTSQPEHRRNLSVLVDGQPVGETIADIFRPDLEAAGIGDGCFAFSFLLPWSAIAARSVSTISVQDSETGEPVGGSLKFYRKAILPVEQRLATIERTLRLMETELAGVDARATREAGLTRSMFGAIGTFFTQLAEMPIDALAAGGNVALRSLLSQTGDQYQPFALAAPAAASLTICIIADRPIGDVHAALQALQISGVDQKAEIILLDATQRDECALLPSIVRNLRYWRISEAESPTAVLNRVGALAGHNLLAFLSVAFQPEPGWLEAVSDTMAKHADCAVLACRVRGEDGTVLSSALLPDRTGRLADFAYGEPTEVPRINRTRLVAAAREGAIVIRRQVFQDLEGFDPSFIDHAATITDFCLRCWSIGHVVRYQPRASLVAMHDTGAGGFAGAASDQGIAALLSERWASIATTRLPASAGAALIIDESDIAWTEEIAHQADLLHGLGYEVSYGAVSGIAVDPACGPALRDHGVIVLQAPVQPTLAAALKNADPPFVIVEITARAALRMAPETLRALSPQPRIILRLDEAAQTSLASGVDTADTQRLRKLCIASDGVITRRSLDVASLMSGDAGEVIPPALLSLAPKGVETRRGLWLILDGTTPSRKASEEWLAVLLPAIKKALPKCQIHTKKRPKAVLPKDIVLHAPSAIDAALLSQFRLALAPFRLPGADKAALSGCLAAGLPVIATTPVMDDAPAPRGVSLVEAKDIAISRVLRKLMNDDDAWSALAEPLLSPLSAEAEATAYAAMITALKPISR